MGEVLRFFFLLTLGEDSGEGLGKDFFFFDDADELGDGVSEGVGLGVAFFFFFAEVEGLGLGVSDGVGEAAAFSFGKVDLSGDAAGLDVGDFCAVDFFFFRGVGVGVGAKAFFNFVPNESSAGAEGAKPARTAMTATATIVSILRRIGTAAISFSPARPAQLC